MSLKDLRNRIKSTKSTRRITSAMKMVSAAKLRRAQDLVEAARPYAMRMERMLGSLAGGLKGAAGAPKLLAGTGKEDTHLLVLVTSDRGLCGGFNSTIVRWTRRRVRELEGAGKKVQIYGIGRKAGQILRRDLGRLFIASKEEVSKPTPSFAAAAAIAEDIRTMFEAGKFDTCTIVYNKFVSALTQVTTPQQLIPFTGPAVAPHGKDQDNKDKNQDQNQNQDTGLAAGSVYDYEPEEETILTALLPRNLNVQVYKAMLESFASEQGARMTAMDNATRNAGKMIGSLSLRYNRARQAGITKELIEIISGAEAV